ncbi:MAG TPA: tetratricopeptide repeat protein [Candidatus Angelobacter sp.]|nr:tetratricopeptide repeat protein [Candidatus Angelobacter sp.]
MLAVLPVQNLTGDSSREYVSDGLTEELIAELGGINPDRLGVIARTSAMSYKRTAKTVDQIGKELGVDYILESSMRESGGKIRFTAQLIRARDQTHLWAHSYERPEHDTLQLQSELANTVAGEVRIDLSPRQLQRPGAQRPPSPDAYDAFVQGRYHANKWSRPELHVAVGYFQKAVEKDPEFARAYAGLADAYAQLTSMRESSPAKTIPKAKDALLKALALDDSLAEAHTSLGWTMDVFDWDWAGAEKEYRRALELNPNDAGAHHRYALHLADMGNFPEALAQIEQARRLDPISPVMMTSTGWILLRARLPDPALLECQKALELDPGFVRGHLCMGEVYEQKGEFQKAADKFLDARVAAGENPELMARFRQTIAQSGYKGYFRARLAQRRQEAKKGYVSPYDFADVYIRLGNKEEALKWLELAYADRSSYLANVQIEPRFDFLRPDPRFQELVRRVGLADVRVTFISDDVLAKSKLMSSQR